MTTGRTGEAWAARLGSASVAAWGLALSAWTASSFFSYAPGEIEGTHEFHSYVYRLIEFRETLAAGYPFPQWATNFRGGLGSPYFGYYQPGLFYVASAFSLVLSPVGALGAAVFLFTLLGYGGMTLLVGRQFGTLAGGLAGTALLLSVYAGTEIHVRGDLSEYSAMMLLPVLLHGVTCWMDEGRLAAWRALPLLCAVLVVLHPVGGVLGYGLLTLAIAWYAAATGSTRRAAWGGLALLLGAGLAGFYWLPVALEAHLVQIEAAAGDYRRHFVAPLDLIGRYTRSEASGHLIPVTLGPVVPALGAFNTATLAVAYRSLAPGQRTMLGLFLIAATAVIFVMSPWSIAVWELLPVLPRIQFPWRALLVLTVVTAGLAGCITPRVGGWWRLLGIACTCGLVAVVAVDYHARSGVHRFFQPGRAAEIASVFFAPDVAHEWLPRGAALMIADRVVGHDEALWANLRAQPVPLLAPRCECGPCRTLVLGREPGRLRWRVETARDGCAVVLPHYFFPVGWRARVDGTPVVMAPDRLGLMRLRLPAGTAEGVVEIAFSATPMRVAGLAMSLVALGAWVVVSWPRRRR